jgi:hypothetical protein
VKIIAALWGPDHLALLGGQLREELRRAGATRLQVNIDDEHILDTVLRLRAFATPVTGVASIWTDGSVDDTIAAVRPAAERIAVWAVEERIPLTPPVVPDGHRAEALAQVAFLRRPAAMTYDAWRDHWQGPHTQIAIDMQATFGYVQNRVTDRLTDDTPPVDAIVEELFPNAAMRDIHAYYGSSGDEAELNRRMTRLMESVSTMGADRHLDVVATSRYVFDLQTG